MIVEVDITATTEEELAVSAAAGQLARAAVAGGAEEVHVRVLQPEEEKP